MKCKLKMLMMCVTLLLLAGVTGLSAVPPTLEVVEKRAITYRLEHVKQGYVRMHVIDYEPAQRRSERLYEVVFDRDRIRQSRRWRKLGEEKWGEPANIILTPKTYVDDLKLNDTPVALVPAKLYKDPKKHCARLNVQALGMDTGGADLLHIAHVESLLHRSDRINHTMARKNTKA